MSQKPKLSARASLALLGAMIGVVAPPAPVSGAAGATGTGTEIQQTQNNAVRPTMTRAQAITANQQLGIEVRGGMGWYAPSRHEVPK